MSAPYAFVSLVTSDYYLPGALCLAAALKDLHPSPPVPPEVEYQTICLVTPETVDVSTIKLLRRAFNVVIGVELIEQEDEKGLKLLGRPDLTHVLTKLHVFRLTQYQKLIFLDADVLPVRPLSHLFKTAHEFAAVPDVGWPDIFNSGVLVLNPGEDKFNELTQLLKTRGSWDGGDQGLLNEWRGGDWHRLSFIYNTTPTAAYTYAPAYERFGSQISAIHFIGPNKPWASIPFRAPGTKSAQKPTPGALKAYDYGSLVDRWYAVYDRHYRSVSPSTRTEFEVRHYASAWDSGNKPGAELPPSGTIAPPGGALGLEDLRKLTMEGMSNLGSSISGAEQDIQEGEYRSMPLEGRVDLMRPKPEPKPEPEQKEGGDHERTPTQEEYKPLHIQPEAAPEQQQHYHEPQHHHWPHHPPHQHRHEIHPAVHHPPSHHPSPPHHVHHPAPRPPSPPKLAWNPAIEPPPNNAPAVNAFPADTYFPNVWDQPPSQQHDATHQSFPPPATHAPAPHSEAFFNPPPPLHIPEQLVTQGDYASVVGQAPGAGVGSPPAQPVPDRAKVHAVFPWEEKPRHVPRRVFPSSDSPPPVAKYIESESPPAPPRPRRDEQPSPATGRLHMPSPTYGLPSTFSFANAWDAVPSIQKYASKLVRPHQHHQPQHPASQGSPQSRRSQATEDDGWKRWERERERVVQARQDASSMDGDDEDEGDDEDSEEEARRQEGKGGSGGSPRRSRSGSTASVTAATIAGKGRKYRGRAVQTIPVETRNFGVQVKIDGQQEPVSVKSGKPSKSSNGVRRDGTLKPAPLLPPPSQAREYRMDPDQMGVATPVESQAIKQAMPFPSVDTPTGLRSPMTLGSPRTYSPPRILSPTRLMSPPRVASPPKVMSPPRLMSPKVSAPPKGPSPPKGSPPRKSSTAQQPQTLTPRRTPADTPPGKAMSPVIAPSTPPQGTPKPPKLSSPFSPPLAMARSFSDETALTSSPSTQDALITPESSPVMGSMRKGGRVWDPARGVDVFKRSSEEVLARFLRMGSFEDDEQRQGQVQQD